MLGIELQEDMNVSRLLAIFQTNGLIVDQFLFNEQSFRIAPPLTISMAEIDKICSTILQSFDQLLHEEN